MIRNYKSFEDYIKSKDGLNDLHNIYGNCCLPLLKCIEDLKLRCVLVEPHKYIILCMDDSTLKTVRTELFGNMASQMLKPMDISRFTYDEDGTLPASCSRGDIKEPYAIVEEPCGAGFRYVGLATRAEYEKYKRENPCCYG